MRHLGRLRRSVINEVCAAKISLDEESWFNVWHHHLDWNGLGQQSRRWRTFFCEQHYRLLFRYHSQILTSGYLAQTWVWFDLQFAGHDAVYVHSPNPHSPFPMKMELDEIDPSELPPELVYPDAPSKLLYYASGDNCVMVQPSVKEPDHSIQLESQSTSPAKAPVLS